MNHEPQSTWIKCSTRMPTEADGLIIWGSQHGGQAYLLGRFDYPLVPLARGFTHWWKVVPLPRPPEPKPENEAFNRWYNSHAILVTDEYTRKKLAEAAWDAAMEEKEEGE